MTRAIEDAVGDLSQYQFSQDSYNAVFATGARDLFTTVRDIRRYGNALPVTLELVRDEIELTDILALEALRVRTPTSFALLTACRDALTDLEAGQGPSSVSGTNSQAQVHAIVQAAGTFAPQVEMIVRRLFPATDRYFSGGTTYGRDWLTTWRRDNRVAHPDVLDIYLKRALPEGALPGLIVRRALASIEDAPALVALLDDLQPAQLESLLERLEDFDDRFPTEEPEIAIAAFYNQRQRLPTEPQNLFDLRPSLRVGRVVLRILRRIDPNDVERVTNAALANISALGDRADLIGLVGHRVDLGHQLVSEPAARRMEDALVNDVLAAPASDLVQEHDLLSLLLATARASSAGFDDRIVELLADDEFFEKLLRVGTRRIVLQPVPDGAVATNYELNWVAITQVVGERRFIARLSEFSKRPQTLELDDRTKLALDLAMAHLGGLGLTD